MNTTAIITGGEIAVSTLGSMAISTAVNADPLWTALISFGVSLVTVVGGALITYLVTLLNKKTKDLKEDDKKSKKEKEE